MNCLFCLVVFTANILGSFNDPFEFDGNYGGDVNSIREAVFEQVISKEALANNLTDFEITQIMKSDTTSVEKIEEYRQQLILEAIHDDLQHGPSLNELISPDLIELLLKKQQDLQSDGFTEADFSNILYFIERYSEQKVFSFFDTIPQSS